MVQLTSITTINLIIMKHFYTVLPPPPPPHPHPPIMTTSTCSEYISCVTLLKAELGYKSPDVGARFESGQHHLLPQNLKITSLLGHTSFSNMAVEKLALWAF